MDNVRVLRVETDNAQKSVKDLRKELKNLRDVLLNVEEGTDEYNKALQEAAGIQHTLREQMEEVNASAMDFGQIVGNVVKTAGAMVAGFQAAQAALNLFGVENEEVAESLKKMQSLMALTQAIPALDDGVKAFKRLKIAIQTATGATSKFGKALIGTGLGAIIAALGYVIANFEDISKWLDEVTGQTDFLGELSDKVVGGLLAGWEAVKQTLKSVGKTIVTYVTSPFKSVWAAIQAYTSTEGGIADKLKAAGKAMKSEFVDEWKDVGSEFKKIGEVAAAGYYKGYSKHKSKRLGEAIEEGKEEGTAKGEAKIEAEEAAYKKRMRLLDAEERDEMLKLQAMGLNYGEYIAKKEALEEEFAKKRIEALLSIIATEKNLTEEEIASLKDELIKLQDSLYKKPETESDKDSGETYESESNEKSKPEQIAEAINASALALGEFSDNPAWGNILKNIATLTANWETLHAQIKEGGQKAFTAYAQIAAVGLGAIGTMLTELGNEQDESNKKGFEAQKKYQYAATVVNMLAGIASAWASSMQLPFPANIIVGSLMSTLMTGTGVMQLTKISKTKFGDNSGASGASSTASPNTSAISSVIAPVQYTQDVQGASIEGAIQDSRVYVTETDITNTQNRVSVTESEARY